MEAGIYKITNNITNQHYIGSSVALSNRKCEHFTDLKFNRHSNPKLQNSYNKYGKEAFVFEIIEELFYPETYEKELIKEHITGREQYYLDTTDPYYNILKIAYSGFGRKNTPEHNRKISLSKIGKKRNITPEWSEKIAKANRGKKKPEGFSEKVSKWMKGKQNALGRILSQDTKNKIGEGNSKKVLQYSLEWVFIKEWRSITEAVTALNINRSHIGSCCQGKRKKTGGFRWKYKKDDI